MKKKIAIMGAGGMLGSMVLDLFAKEKDFAVLATVYDEREIEKLKKYKNVKFCKLDVGRADTDTLKKALKDSTWIVNCIGIIKPYIHDENAAEVERAVRINALFPHVLSRAVAPAKVIQIATDCAYSGKKGGYKESDAHDALDVYGKSKSIGEVHLSNMYNIRCSIVGPELAGHLSLMDWFLTQPRGAQVNGFKNHFWNGVTTYHFAKICAGIIKNDIKIKHLQHIVPSDKLSKGEMLKAFGLESGRKDIKVKLVNAPKVIDRTLQTENPKLNNKIWRAAGYKKIPTVGDMIKELASFQLESQ